MKARSRIKILEAVSDWLKLLALVVLVVEGVILYAIYRMPDGDSRTVWLVVAMLVFLLALVGGIFQDRSSYKRTETNEVDRLKEQLNQYEIASKDVGERLTEHIIHKIGTVSVTYRMIDLDGSLKTNWKFDEVRIVRPGASLPVLSHDLRFSPPDATVTKYPELYDTNWNRDLNIETYDKSHNGFRCELIIPGSLQHGESLSYGFIAEVAKGFFVTKEEVEANSPPEFKKEFWGYSVASVIDQLDVQVFFPEGYGVRCYFGVCMGFKIRSDNSMHSGELSRIRDNGWFASYGASARLTVRKPLIGFSYLIYWVPPTQKIVAALKTAT